MGARVEIEGAEQLRALAAKLAGADKEIQGALRKELTAAARPIVAEMRSTVLGPGGRSTGKGSAQRAAYRMSRSKSKRATAARSAEKASGLRQTIARATGSTATASTRSVNLTFRTKSSQLPPSQRKLARAWNRPKGWRHPVFGHADTWVTQVGSQYFDAVIKKNVPVLATGAKAAMETAAEAILHT